MSPPGGAPTAAQACREQKEFEESTFVQLVKKKQTDTNETIYAETKMHEVFRRHTN